MTSFYATYIFISLAVIFMGLGLWFRHWLLYIASGICWGVPAMYGLIESRTEGQYVWALALFCLAMAIIMFFANWWLPKKKMQSDEFSQFNTSEDWAGSKEREVHAKTWGKPLDDTEAYRQEQQRAWNEKRSLRR